MSDELRDRVALVTGASGGIGRALSLRLAEGGARVAAHYSSGVDRAERLVEEIGRERAAAFGADLSQPLRSVDAARVMRGNPRAVLRQPERERAPDAAARPGDERDPVSQLVAHP